MFFPYSKLESKILSELAKGPKLVSDLVLKLQPITNQAVNYALRQLVSKRMIFKVKETVSINLFYLEEEKVILDTIFDTYKKVQTKNFPNQNLEEGESFVYHLEYDYQIEDLWGSLPLLLLFENNQKSRLEPYMIWDPAPFWLIVHYDEFMRFYTSLEKRGFRMQYGILKMNSEVVRSIVKNLQKENIRHSYMNHKILKQEVLPNICGDFVISVKYRKAFIKKLCDLICSGNVEKISEHMKTKTKIVFTIERSSKKAESYRKAFEQFFAVKK